MPDWTYHPFFKPLLFRLPAEDGRRLTLSLLSIQARTAVGRRVFRWFGYGPPPPALAVGAFGLRFPGPVGLAAGIDVEGTAASVMQHLGFGFLIVGPVGSEAVARRPATDPLRIAERHAIVASRVAGGPGAHRLASCIARAAELAVPIGVALRPEGISEAIAALDDRASFYVVDEDDAALAAARRATKRPLLVRIAARGDGATTEAVARALAVAERAKGIGVDGCIAIGGAPTELLVGGEVSGPFLARERLAVIRALRERFGDELPIVASGGITTPRDAVDSLGAGATLVELYDGLVYAGPGLPARILGALQDTRNTAAEAVPDEPASRRVERLGRWLLALTGWSLIGSGAFALVLAATVKLLPYDTYYLGVTVDELCARNACRIVHFMAHDRVSFGGSIMSIGILYVWLETEVRAGRAWAWWTLLISGALGFASFLTYLGYGYLDVWHGRATLALLPCFLAGLVISHASLRLPRGPGALFRRSARAWMWSPAGRGRLCLTFSAIGMILGGVIIMCVGVTRVFVPQDLEYMGLTAADLQAVSPRLVPLIAHDRAGFGGGLFSGGIIVLLTVWCGTRPAARALWWALFLSGSIGFGCAIGVHPIVGYTTFVHLAPAYAGALAFLIGIALLYGPMCRVDAPAAEFPDL